MTQKSSSRNEEAGSTKGGPASFCVPALVRWYLELKREEVLKRRKRDSDEV
jgi:hypothetical protein